MTAAWAAVTLTFFTLRFASGDPLAGLLAQGLATPEQAEGMRRRLGLDLPLGDQYFRFLAGLPRGDFGRSLFTGRPVTEIVAEQLPHTMALGASAFVVGLLLGAAVGIAAGWSRSRWAARSAEGVAVLSTSLPVAFTGLVALWAAGRAPIDAMPLLSGGPPGLLLPALVLGFASSGAIAKVIGAGLRDSLGASFVLAARARGLGRGRRLLWHALRPVLGTALSLAALEAAFLFGGTVITETIFARPGLGRLLVGSILQGDYPVAQGVVVLAALLYTATQIVGDFAVQLTDPRARPGA